MKGFASEQAFFDDFVEKIKRVNNSDGVKYDGKVDPKYSVLVS